MVDVKKGMTTRLIDQRGRLRRGRRQFIERSRKVTSWTSREKNHAPAVLAIAVQLVLQNPVDAVNRR